MSKRSFRPHLEPRADQQQPGYPLLEASEQTRRRFLARLGAAVLGTGALGALAGCGERPYSGEPDATRPLAGEPLQPDAGLDAKPDMPLHSGGAPLPDAGLDQGQPDGEVLMGIDRQPDAGLDLRRDREVLLGDPALPDAAIDSPDAEVWAGVPALPDGGSGW